MLEKKCFSLVAGCRRKLAAAFFCGSSSKNRKRRIIRFKTNKKSFLFFAVPFHKITKSTRSFFPFSVIFVKVVSDVYQFFMCSKQFNYWCYGENQANDPFLFSLFKKDKQTKNNSPPKWDLIYAFRYFLHFCRLCWDTNVNAFVNQAWLSLFMYYLFRGQTLCELCRRRRVQRTCM